MASVSELNEWGIETGAGVDSARVTLGAVMVATLVAVAVAVRFFDPSVAAGVAVAMVPVLFVAVLRAPLEGCSIYGSLTRRR